MICEKNVRKFCCEDISLIENYEKAINSNEMWDCHHRLETDLNLSKKELIDTGRYYGVKAKYLVFMTPFEHNSLHNKNKKTKDETKTKISNTMKINGSTIGVKNGMYGKHHKKYKWLTPYGNIKIMALTPAKRFHPDWTFLE